MNILLKYLLQPASMEIVAIALLFLRVAIGSLMVIHGLSKLLGGVSTWRFLGIAMGNLGIHFLPVLWGLACVCTEFFGGISLVLGLGTRISCLFLMFNMIVALIMHLSNRDSYEIYSHSLTLIIIFITFFIVGSGNYSIDAQLL